MTLGWSAKPHVMHVVPTPVRLVIHVPWSPPWLRKTMRRPSAVQTGSQGWTPAGSFTSSCATGRNGAGLAPAAAGSAARATTARAAATSGWGRCIGTDLLSSPGIAGVRY